MKGDHDTVLHNDLKTKQFWEPSWLKYFLPWVTKIMYFFLIYFFLSALTYSRVVVMSSLVAKFSTGLEIFVSKSVLLTKSETFVVSLSISVIFLP